MLEVTQSFDLISAQSAEFAVPGINRGLGDVVPSRDVIDGGQARFAQDLYYLAFRKIHFLHGYREGPLAVGGKIGRYLCMVPDQVR